MTPDAMTLNAFLQHAAVSAVALAALAVVLRRVLGVFEKRPTTQVGPGHAAPGCSHCAAGTTATKKPARR